MKYHAISISIMDIAEHPNSKVTLVNVDQI